MGTHSDPRSLTSSRILIGTKEREVTSLADMLGFIRECDGDGLAELLSSRAQDVDATDGQAMLALKGRLDAFRHVLSDLVLSDPILPEHALPEHALAEDAAPRA